jgi:hypothetical protein
LRTERRRVGGIALEHLDRDGAAVVGAQQADHQLRAVIAMIAAVTIVRKRAVAPLQIGRGDIVEQQSAIPEMPTGERGFDKVLFAAEPIERAIKLLGGDLAEAQHFAERMTSRSGIEHPRGGELGGRIEQPGDDQGERKIATTLRRAAGQEFIERDLPGCAERGEHMAVRQRPGNLNGLAGGQ